MTIHLRAVWRQTFDDEFSVSLAVFEFNKFGFTKSIGSKHSNVVAGFANPIRALFEHINTKLRSFDVGVPLGTDVHVQVDDLEGNLGSCRNEKIVQLNSRCVNLECELATYDCTPL